MFAVLAAVGWLFLQPAISSAQIVVDTASDVADPPFDADGPCGNGSLADLPGADGKISLREAIIAANNTVGPQTITFAPALADLTIVTDFDDADADDAPDVLPTLCGGGTTIDGDLDGDGSPNITIDGKGAFAPLTNAVVLFSSDNRINGMRVVGYDVGISVVHIGAFTPALSSANNAITNNVVQDAVSCIVVEAGSFSDVTQPGVVSDTSIIGNLVSGCSGYGIFVFTGDAPGSTVAHTTIEGNRVLGSNQFGIAMQANLSTAGSGTLISDTAVHDNDVEGAAITGITAFSYGGSENDIRALRIGANRVSGGGTAIAVTAGSCGAVGNEMQAEVASNDVIGGLAALGGSNIGCPGTPPAARQNRGNVVVRDNRVAEPTAPGLNLLGGYDKANGNELVATVEDNQVAALAGITVVGGQGGTADDRAANENTVDAILRRNATGGGGVGLSISPGGSNLAGDNLVRITAEENTACNGLLGDVQCYGGLIALPGFPANRGSGNRASGSIARNQATAIVTAAGTAGNECAVEIIGNVQCTPGDVNCDIRIGAADLLAHADAVSSGVAPVCGLDADESVILATVFSPR